MNQKQMEVVRRQMQDQAARLGDQQGTEAVLSVLDTCAAMLKAVWPDAQSVEDREDFEDLFYAYLSIAAQVGQFSKLTAGRLSADRQTELAAGTDEELERVRKRAEEARAALERRQKEKERLDKQLQEYQEKLSPLEAEARAVDQQLAECTQERLDALKAENDHKREVLGANGETLRMLKKESEGLTEQMAAQQCELDKIPQETKDKRGRFLQMQQELEELKNGKALYAPEKLDQLQGKIEKLSREVNQLSTRYKTLSERHTKLTQEKETLEERFPDLEREMLEAVKKALETVRPRVDENLREITQLRTDADAVTEHLDLCDQLRRDYRSWLNADETPLAALLRVMDEADSRTLRETLDVSQCRTVRSQLDRAKEDLRQLDETLDRLMNAYHQDVFRIHQEATRRG